MPVGSPRPGIQLQSPKTNDEDVKRPGGRAVPHLFRVRTLAILPTLCQQHSAADDDHREQGQHVRHHAAGGAQKVVSRVVTSFFIEVTRESENIET